MVATSYWPAWLAKSWLILSRTSFSGSAVKLTLMPVALVKWSAVSFWRSIIGGLLTISTLMEWPAGLPAPPAPAHAASRAMPRPTAAAGTALLVPRVLMVVPFRVMVSGMPKARVACGARTAARTAGRVRRGVHGGACTAFCVCVAGAEGGRGIRRG